MREAKLSLTHLPFHQLVIVQKPYRGPQRRGKLATPDSHGCFCVTAASSHHHHVMRFTPWLLHALPSVLPNPMLQELAMCPANRSKVPREPQGSWRGELVAR